MRYLYLFPLLIAMQFSAFFVAPVALLFAGKTLPAWAWHWGNDTDTIDGDADHRDRRTAGWPQYFRRLLWLYRNRAHNWSRSVGCIQDSQCRVAHFGVRPSNYHGTEGEQFSIGERDGVVFLHYYRIKRHRFWPSRGERIRLFHKLDDDTKGRDSTYIAALVLYYHPCVKMPLPG